MPELPEVQTIITDLQTLTGDHFTGFWSDFEKALSQSISAKTFEKGIVGKKIINIQRLGKIILFNLDNGKSIAIHLKMTGKLLLMEHATWNIEHAENKHFHHAFFLKKHGIIAFSDVRKFATITLLNDDSIKKIKSKYGIDPVNDIFSISDLKTILEKRKNKPIKVILMDNFMILGIGNIYASEILFDAGISPLRKGETLKSAEIKKLHKSIKKILQKAIRLRGTSVSDYRDSKGLKGSFQNELKVYKKNGQKCINCDTIIEKVILGQRSSFFCPKCQN